MVTPLVAYFAATVWCLLGLIGSAIGYAVLRNETTEEMRNHGWHLCWDNDLLMPWPVNPDSWERRLYGVGRDG